MGCDIHAHYEIKVKGRWVYYTQANITRNYIFFAKLANVRNYFEIYYIDEPRGLPEDITELVKIHSDYMVADAHSHSCISSKEYAQVMEFVDNFDYGNDTKRSVYNWDSEPFLFGNGFESFHKYREDYPEFLEDFRFIFWFDN